MVGLVGVEARVQVRSASRQRAKKYQQSYERCSRDVQESQESQESDLRLARCFQQSNLALPTGGLSNRLSVWGGAPPMSRLAGLEFKFCDISSLLGKINLSIFIHV